MNLITNASEAIGDQVGCIRISTGRMECDESDFAETYVHDGLQKGTYVFLEVTDSGWPGLPDSGVPEEPLSLPSDAQMADLVLTELAGRLAEEILAKAMSIRRATYEEGMRLEKEGLFEDALDRYAAFVLMAGDAFPLEARVAGDKIERRWGLAIAEDGSIDISNLRLD